MNTEPKSVPLDQIVIDAGINPQPDADCPNCGEGYDIARGCYIGISVRNGPRLCSACINASVPDLAAVLDVVIDLQYVIEEAEHPDLLAMASRALLKAAVQELLYDIDWLATNAKNTMCAVPSEATGEIPQSDAG